MYREIKQLAYGFAIEVIGCNLHQNMSSKEIDHLKGLMLENKVVIFRDQQLSAEEQIAVCKQFGEIEPHPLKSNTCPYPEMSIISNINEEGKAVGYAGPQFLLWHSDMCYEITPPKFSFLYAERVPEHGGKTLFADTQRAYAELDDELKSRIKDMQARFGFSDKLMQRCKARDYDLVIAEEDQRPDATHPVVRNHPVTGIPSIFVNWTHTDSIVGLPEAESDALLKQLYDHCEQEKYRYTHSYRTNDLIVWDNGATIHTGDGSNTMATPRIMRRVVIR